MRETTRTITRTSTRESEGEGPDFFLDGERITPLEVDLRWVGVTADEKSVFKTDYQQKPYSEYHQTLVDCIFFDSVDPEDLRFFPKLLEYGHWDDDFRISHAWILTEKVNLVPFWNVKSHHEDQLQYLREKYGIFDVNLPTNIVFEDPAHNVTLSDTDDIVVFDVGLLTGLGWARCGLNEYGGFE